MGRGGMTLEGRVPPLFCGGSADQVEVAATIAATRRATGELVDPHTAVGLAVAARNRPPQGTPLVTLATAHPAKFPEAVLAAAGVAPELPTRYRDLMALPERCTTLDNDLATVEATVRATFGAA